VLENLGAGGRELNIRVRADGGGTSSGEVRGDHNAVLIALLAHRRLDVALCSSPRLCASRDRRVGPKKVSTGAKAVSSARVAKRCRRRAITRINQWRRWKNTRHCGAEQFKKLCASDVAAKEKRDRESFVQLLLQWCQRGGLIFGALRRNWRALCGGGNVCAQTIRDSCKEGVLDRRKGFAAFERSFCTTRNEQRTAALGAKSRKVQRRARDHPLCSFAGTRL
tara:strand:- start:1575 stop:2243 length:669 start_codon:yes stop_codon:yes gene_type:complete